MHKLINADCLQWLRSTDDRFDAVFADPPDAIGLNYSGFVDRFDDYYGWCHEVLTELLRVSPVVWWSFNANHLIEMAYVVKQLGCDIKPCVQTFTFGQNRKTDLGSGHRPLWRLSTGELRLYPEQILTPSWRLLNGDKRANPVGAVPLDVFDFPRVTGNSRQRRAWHPTQLNEGLVERCVKLVTKPGDRVLDPFGGTGTTLRVCKRIDRWCTLIEVSGEYCDRLTHEHSELSSEVANAQD
jgi:DNA modification methylase